MHAILSEELGLDLSPTSPSHSLFPKILLSDRSHLDAFVEFYQPEGTVENVIVQDIAHQASDMKKWAEFGDAIRRDSSQQLAVLGEVSGGPTSSHDSTVSFACSTEASDRAERYLLAHTRNFYRALNQLETLQARRKGVDSANGPPMLFRTEADCEAYLSRRFASGEYSCEQCGHSRGFVIATRKVWECGQCGRQTGFRSGTLMAGSRVPLLAWFSAIGWILWRPTIDAAELAERIGIRRLGTVRALRNRIRQALASGITGARLAALDQHYSRHSHLTQVRAVNDSRPSHETITTGAAMN